METIGCNTSGGGSYVVRAQVRHSGLECAVKTLTSHCPSRLKEIEKELEMLHGSLEKHKEMSHYIVDFYGAFVMEGRVRVVLELMDGSLAQLIQSKVVMPEEILASIFKLLLNGLDYLQRQLRVVHRDIKPSNVLYNKEGCVKISDFGISAMLDSSTSQAATFIGTVTYMSPERLEGESYSFTADIWSVGILALELVKGHNPYWDSGGSGPSDVYYHILQRLRTAGPPQLLPQNPPENFKPLYSEEFSSFISLCLQSAKHSRPCARQLLNHDWIANFTMSEESLDEARLHDWFATVAVASRNWGNPSSQPAQENLQAEIDNLIHSVEA